MNQRGVVNVFKVYPRVCGGSGYIAGVCLPFPGLSPRVRGKLAPLNLRRPYWGSIPACAGEAIAGHSQV